MAAAALLRSVARRIVRVPPPHPRPLVARGLHGSGPGGSLPPPTRNEIQDPRGNRLAAGIAAAGLPPFASKMARAPPPLRRLLHDSTSPKQSSRPPAAKFAYFSLFAAMGFLYFSVMPRTRELYEKWVALLIEREALIKAVEECQRTHMKSHPVLADSSQDQSMQAPGQGKESDGQLP